MSRTHLLACILTASIVSSAAADPGLDLAVGGCAGDMGASANATVDCANGRMLQIVLTWSPAEDLPDLSNIDGYIDTFVGTSFMTHNFWDFDAGSGCNRGSLSATQIYPSTGCGTPITYLDTWTSAGSSNQSGSAISAASTTTETCRYAFTCYRATPLSVIRNEHLFGAIVQISLQNPLFNCPGCSDPVCMQATSVQPETFDKTENPTLLTGPTSSAPGFSNRIGLNGGATLCVVTPVRQRTWGELKSLYR